MAMALCADRWKKEEILSLTVESVIFVQAFSEFISILYSSNTLLISNKVELLEDYCYS